MGFYVNMENIQQKIRQNQTFTKHKKSWIKKIKTNSTKEVRETIYSLD